MRILVFGSSGQVARSLEGLGSDTLVVKTLGRPEGDISVRSNIINAVDDFSPDIVVNAAAYTAVDAAETDEANAYLLNCTAPGYIAEACAVSDIPVVHYSTDYVFAGDKPLAYDTTDPVSPLGAYGRTKEAGETAIRSATARHVILRTAWVFSPFGKNFVKTMLTLGKTRDELNVVMDQIGNPTYAPDIANATVQIARNILASPENSALYGTFHLTNTGDTSWHGFATEIFRQAEGKLGISCVVNPIPSSEFPTPAKRPANSRLDGTLLETVHGVKRRHWSEALAECLQALETEFKS